MQTRAVTAAVRVQTQLTNLRLSKLFRAFVGFEIVGWSR